MPENYLYLDIPTEPFVNYFLNDYIPKNNIIDIITSSNLSHVEHQLKNKPEKSMMDLNSLLNKEYKIPFKIEYFSIFYHSTPQSIHTDGITQIRYSSLNLPLTNYQDTKMLFYKIKNETNTPIVQDAFYFKKDDLDVIEELPGKQQWVLVNSGIPHNVVCTNHALPRITLCVRFLGNPKFELLKSYISNNPIY